MAQARTEQTLQDLHKALGEKREELRQFRFGASGSRASNPRAGREIRKEIARILTEINRRRHTHTEAETQ